MTGKYMRGGAAIFKGHPWVVLVALILGVGIVLGWHFLPAGILGGGGSWNNDAVALKCTPPDEGRRQHLETLIRESMALDRQFARYKQKLRDDYGRLLVEQRRLQKEDHEDAGDLAARLEAYRKGAAWVNGAGLQDEWTRHQKLSTLSKEYNVEVEAYAACSGTKARRDTKGWLAQFGASN